MEVCYDVDVASSGLIRRSEPRYSSPAATSIRGTSRGTMAPEDSLKRCFKCGIDKSRTEFYRHLQMGDGLLGKCKACARYDTKANQLAKFEYYQAYKKEYATRPATRARARRITKEWRLAHPGRAGAHYRAEKYLRDAPEYCERCLLVKTLQRHHPDYSQPLLIEWLCKRCHAVADRERRAREANDR